MGSQCICLTSILIDTVFRTGSNYYPQVFLEKCRYVVKGKKMLKYITEDIENSDEEILMKRILMKKNLMKKILANKIEKILV